MVLRTLLMTGAAALLVACGGGGSGGGDISAVSITQGAAAKDSPVARGASDGPDSFAADATEKASAARPGDIAIRPLALSPLSLRPSQVPLNSVRLQSDWSDVAGGGSNYEYSHANALILVAAKDATLSIYLRGDDTWSGDLALPRVFNRFQVGTYHLPRSYTRHYPVPDDGGFLWTRSACTTVSTDLRIHSAAYDGDALQSISFSFEQHCDGNDAALRGQVFWSVFDKTSPPGPVNPIPSQLWMPDAGVMPSNGSYIYLESTPGEFVGQGQRYIYQRTTALLDAKFASFGDAQEKTLWIEVKGDEQWSGQFAPMLKTQIQAGYYGALLPWPNHNPAKGGMRWYGEGRGCNTAQGWFAVDQISYLANGELASLDLRFEQRCDGSLPLRGKIHWVVDDQSVPPPPVNPPPPELWAPAPGATPSDGNFVYLTSDPGEWVGIGGTYLHTPANSNMDLSSDGGDMTVAVSAPQGPDWRGEFATMNTLNQFQPGYYGDLRRHSFHNQTKGGLSWSGMGHGCTKLKGWFTVDAVAYAGAQLKSIDLRFEQRCEEVNPRMLALRGRVRWGY